MCGIAGWIAWDKNISQDKEIIEAMGDTLIPRGPDEGGTWISDHAVFAHRRLIVIDPAGGKQPMVKRYGSRTLVLVYNGELYNTQELRSSLEKAGHLFSSHSDTEVLLTAFAEWGPECVKRLNGIFAFAVWDSHRKELFLARDHLGVKPLFFLRRGNNLIFASEIKAILAHPSVPAQVDNEGLAEIFTLGPARTPGTGVFKNIEELKPGCTLTLNKKNTAISSFWRLESHPHEDNLEETITNIRHLFEDGVKRQLISDVPICSLLSGGLDSSAICAVASQEHPSINTYSVDYTGNDLYFRPNDFQPDSDTPWARKVSGFLGTKHNQVFIDTAQLTEELDRAVSARDLPGMADVDSSLYLFSKEIKKNATVVLSGECADEILGGYPWFWREDSRKADTFPWSLKLNQRIKWLSSELKDYCRPEEYAARRYREALEEVPRLPGEDPTEARIREIFYLTITRWMPVLLDRKDRMSMAAGLEIRVPFCDHRLVEYLWNVPWKMKSWGNREKGIFRKAMEGTLPKDVLYRKKSPYPKTFDPIFLDTMKGRILESLNDPQSSLKDLVDKKEILRLTEQGSDFDIPWFGQLMRLPQLLAYLLQVEIWFEKYNVSVV